MLFAFRAALLLACSLAPSALAQRPIEHWIGVARIDVTPREPVRLSGYGNRRAESEGVEQRLWAKALALGSREAPALLIAVDNCGVPAWLVDEAHARIARRVPLARERFAVASTHTHSAPMLNGVLGTLFGEPIPPEHQQRIDRYTAFLLESLESVGVQALEERRPGRMSRALGEVGFARNRRVVQSGSWAGFGVQEGGPVDHDLPLLVAAEESGAPRALVVSYACHCTTLGGGFNQSCGDWAGYAQEELERDHPGAVALVLIGCGADANPHPRGALEHARAHGRAIADEVGELLQRGPSPLGGELAAVRTPLELAFDPLPSRAEWEARARQSGAVGHHARVQLERLARGEALATHLPYAVQTWSFGEEHALVFLPGEVVVDYALALKRTFRRDALMVNAYCNDVPCYIPSRRILREGGYEAEGAMIYYDRPARLSPELEERILGAVEASLPASLRNPWERTEGIAPLAPREALASFTVPPGFEIELVACEPAVVDPVAIDWSLDGALWVAEMRDYPSGMDGRGQAGGTIRRLTDEDRDGSYETSRLFLEGLPYPTGLLAVGRGLIVCAAPQVFYAEDADGDGRAEQRIALLEGFETGNQQARVNGLSFGLDGWIYGSTGLFGGEVRSVKLGTTVDLRGGDFRFQLGTGALEREPGPSQQGRVRNDWDEWFGNDNSNPLWHYPLDERYARRNPLVAMPAPRHDVARGADPRRVFPRSALLERFNDPQMANRFTSACGPLVFRDVSLGEELYGDAFVCEPVHNLVQRLELARDGSSWVGTRAAREEREEFLASSDPWFRPVQARLGPDGALWIVDMYRFVIEHPRWIPEERLKQLDVRAGANRGRIYRVFRQERRPSPIVDRSRADERALVELLGSTNGTLRDLAQRELVARGGRAAAPELERLSRESAWAPARLQALWTLQQLGALTEETLHPAFRDREPGVRRGALRLAEALDTRAELVRRDVLLRLGDAEPCVRLQLALTLGQFSGAAFVKALAELARREGEDERMRAAILSSASACAAPLLAALEDGERTAGIEAIEAELVAIVAANEDRESTSRALLVIAARALEHPPSASAFDLAARLLEALSRARGGAPLDLEAWGADASAALRGLDARAADLARETRTATELRIACVRLLGRVSASEARDREILASVLAPEAPPELRAAALESLARTRDAATASLLLERWRQLSLADRTRVLEILLSRDAWIASLVEALRTRELALLDLSHAQQELLLQRGTALGLGSQELLASLRPAPRAEALAQLRPALALQGDTARGAERFGALCASCHRVRGQGFAVGPDLAALGDRSAPALLLAIVDPNAAVLDGYRSYEIEREDGRVELGLIAEETATALTLVQASGHRTRLLRREIAEVRVSPFSLMPNGLERGLSPQDLADLIAFVRSEPALFGSGSPEELAAARRAFLAAGATTPGEVRASESLAYPSWLGVQPLHLCRQSDGRSELRWSARPLSGTPDAGFVRFRFAAAMGFRSQPSGAFHLSVGEGETLRFDVALGDEAWQSPDGSLRLRYYVAQRNAEDSNGVLELEVAAARANGAAALDMKVTGSAAGGQRWFGVYLIGD